MKRNLGAGISHLAVVLKTRHLAAAIFPPITPKNKRVSQKAPSFFIEPGQLFHCHRDCEAAARVCQKRQGNCPKCPQKASGKPRKGVSDVAEHPPDHFLEVECDEEDTKIHVDFGLAGVAEALVLLVVFHLSEDGLRLYRPSAAPE